MEMEEPDFSNEEPEERGMPRRRGRGSAINPANRFDRLHLEDDPAELDEEELRQVQTEFLIDTSRNVLAKNTSPDVPFTYSLNPYRGCEHGCAYCYARPSHEYLGFSAGLDFETRIMVKPDAPDLLAAAFDKRSWQPQVVALSGNTDPYQPVERRLKLTRKCLEVFLDYRNPVGIITKNHLITRDIDILSELAERDLVAATISITSLKPEIIGEMEPRTSRPAARLKAIEQLASAGITVGVNAAPLIPGLTDDELPAILRAAADAGASYAGYILVRLPGPVEPIFVDWLKRAFPNRVDRVLNRLRDIRGGRLSDPRFGSRMKGEGEWADLIADMFEMHCRKLGLNSRRRALSTQHFRRPVRGQSELFD
jgi:DNA repair photolyase